MKEEATVADMLTQYPGNRLLDVAPRSRETIEGTGEEEPSGEPISTAIRISGACGVEAEPPVRLRGDGRARTPRSCG